MPFSKLSNKLGPIITGTAILTLASLITRLIGFFYRMFLSANFGEEGMGVYQLTSPVLALSYALCISGFQTAVSKYVAAKEGLGQRRFAAYTLFLGLFFSLLLSIPCTILIYGNADFIGEFLLSEIRTAPLIRIIALSIPLSCVHSCLNGYFLGRKKAAISASTQLFEQISRVLSVFIICNSLTASGNTPPLSVAATGLLIGEGASTLLSVIFFTASVRNISSNAHSSLRHEASKLTISILKMAAIINMNRIIVNLFASVETIMLPQSLEKYGLTSSDALSLYGVLCGMVLPLLLFPNALTGSISVMLLPTISEADEKNQTDRIKAIANKTFLFCFGLGILCMLFFLFTGKFLGQMMFHSEIAGEYIVKLSFICPLLYLSSALSSILNGKGKTIQCLITQVLGLAIRILFLLFLIPLYGIHAYIIGLILSQFISTLLSLWFLKKYI
ncbi:MAG: oligosaccharide flippase family protein [Lachnospiraceae bacterium]|nr:oligosaccharide flippase family protein [Lachnospiraceae bacterium]